MASRTPAAHAAGIFSDMTVDGPEIGTLVVIIDRAKNLPNRKSIGKQDPYCAARLGKEAKKTETDKRGGQTPKWDQEMRFTVHDSADYYQLKVSVFNDDKKTELIGETYISLKEIIVPGGGQNDIWHNLNYRGKYAGEIRMEITYYDSRPKEEKNDRTREGTPSNVGGAVGRDNAGGPRVMKERVKRRPLPSDPITGQSPAMPPAPVRVGPREPRSKAQIEEQSKPPVQQPQLDAQAPYPTGHLEYQQQQRYPPEQEQHGGYGTTEQYRQSPQAPYQQSQQCPPQQSPLQRVEYGTPQQGRYGQPAMDQSPMQDYNGQPPLGMARSNPSLISQQSNSSYSAPPLDVQSSQKVRELYQERYGYNQPQADPYAQNNAPSSRVDDAYNRGVADTTGGYAPQQAAYNPPPPSQFDAPPSPDGPPPPPPAHRIMHQSATAASSPGYGYAPPNPVKDRLEHLRDGHRNSMPAYSNTSPAPHQAIYSTPPPVGYAPQPQAHMEPAPPIANPQPRHKLLENTYDNHYSSMQPTVEDAPPTPSPYQQTAQARNQPQQPQYTASPQQYEENVPSPAPLSLGRRPSALDMNQRPSTANADAYNANSSYNAAENRPVSPYRDQQAPPPQAPPPQEWQKPDWAQEDRRSRSPAPPPVEYGHKPEYAPERSRSPAPPMGQQYGQPAYRSDDRRSRSPAPPQNDQYEDRYRSRSPAPPPVAYDQKPYGERSVSPAPTSRWQREEAPLERPGSGYMPPLPPTLVAGLDPLIAKEISDRIYSDSRFHQPRERQPGQQDNYAARVAAQRREDAHARPGSSHRAQNDSPSRFAQGNGYGSDRERERQGRPQSSHYNPSQNRAVSPNPVIAAAGAGRFYAQQTRAISPAPTMHNRPAVSPAPSSYRRAVSPAPSHMHTISRKSVSPAPPSRGSDQGLGWERKVSAVPFGPDDYAALNPNAPAPQHKVSADNVKPGSADPGAKIVLKGGREVDPSDHLPSSSWAALPPNLQKKRDEREGRERERSRDGRGPQTAAARRMERIERMERRERPQSYGREGYGAPQQRNRLVRKVDRMGQQPVSPNPYDSRGDGRGRYDEPRDMSRAQTFDTFSQPISEREREVYGPGGRYGGGGGRNYAAPAAPPKIPLPHTNSGPPAPDGGMGGVRFGMEGRDPNEAAWSLLEEMKSIDLGSGPARRRRQNHSMA